MKLRIALTLALALAAIVVVPAFAHRPYFEEEDISYDTPWHVDDPTISTALYATLESADDVDYYTFEGKRDQEILLELAIPQIEGQVEFAPYMALIGTELPGDDLPEKVVHTEEAGVLVIPPPPGPAPTFYEPFSRTSYWERQQQRIRLPSDGRFVVAVWHPDGQVGRYTFVIGDKERPGGDLAFPLKMRRYWTPVPTPEPTRAPVLMADQGHMGERCQ